MNGNFRRDLLYGLLYSTLLYNALLNIRYASAQNAFDLPDDLESTGKNGEGYGEVIMPKSPAANNNEPTCEELRAMWRFSKRQSRAPEISNEIPTYRDPFLYNRWEPYYTAQENLRRMGSRTKYKQIPPRTTFGTIVHHPVAQFQDILRNRGWQQENRMGGKKQTRPRPKYRFANGLGIGGIGANGMANPGNGLGGGMSDGDGMGGGGGGGLVGASPQNLLPPQRDSFLRLKELVWSEKMKELQQQRKAEEEAARAMILRYVVGQR